MKRGKLLGRVFLVYGIIIACGITVAVLTVMKVLAPPPPSVDPAQFSRDSLAALAILDRTPRHNPWTERMDSMPPGGTRLDVDRRIAHGRVFNDSNYLHIEAASALGISPIDTEEDAWNLKRPMVHLQSCEDYYIDKLTHSLPYLVPEAEQLLHEIGRAFRDSLAARGGGEYRIKVTSILRTNSSIRRLRRRNGNAVGGSAHLYGTTFDLSYSNFACDSVTTPRTTEDLKLLLAEILRDFRDRGRCYVKHERKQSCFHITTRPIAVENEIETNP